MANNLLPQNNKPVQGVLVRGTVILRIPDLDTDELTKLYQMAQAIVDEFGGEFDVTTQPQPPALNP